MPGRTVFDPDQPHRCTVFDPDQPHRCTDMPSIKSTSIGTVWQCDYCRNKWVVAYTAPSKRWVRLDSRSVSMEPVMAMSHELLTKPLPGYKGKWRRIRKYKSTTGTTKDND